MDIEPGAHALGLAAPGELFAPPTFSALRTLAVSPSPVKSFQGLDDIAMVDSSYIIIPPDVSGAVGPAKLMCGFNNNYRVQDKSTGATQITVGTATFWNPVITDKTLLAQLTDPRTVYDPIQNRWIVAMQTVNQNGLVLFGVSQTSDPAGGWYLYAVQLTPTGYLIDFPTLGFNKNWICVSINRYTTAGAFNRGVQIVANYAQARTGTLSSVTQFDPGMNTAVRFCASPCVTLSATEDTLFLPTHLGSAGATYQVDVITGTPSAPVYTSGATQTRPGGGWTQPSGNQLPQSAPNAGGSACGATPCPIESQDSQIRSAPTYRLDSTTSRAFIYYTQTIRLTTPVARNVVQWTKITPGGGGTAPAFADGGRIDDGTAANQCAFPHIAVNAAGDFIVGYSRFGSGMHPAAGYSVHFAADGLGTIRDPLPLKVGDDYYHKTFSTTTGRNRWGDFSTAQVDPSDDRTLWVLQEYAKTRTGTDDGNTGSNSSRWSSWWGAVATDLVATIAAGPSHNEGNSGTTPFDFTVNLSAAAGAPVTINYQTSDGTATTADNDYQPASSSIVIPSMGTSGTITVLANGDTKCESNETFSVTLTSATNATIGSPSVSTGTILNDELETITASAGAGGTISPSGAVSVSCGANKSFTITPDACHAIADVVVDNVSQGAQSSYTFTNVTANHTISASFSVLMSLGQIHVDASCNGASNGSINLTVSAASPPVTYAWSNGATSEDLSGLAAGPYSVTVTDANACTGSLSVTIGQPAVLALSETHTNVSTCGGTNGSIDLTVAGGTPAYGYAWNNGATSQDLTGLGAGTYTVTVTDAHACTATTSVTITAPGAPTVSETHTNVSCNGGSNGSVNVTVTGGTGPFTYAWSNGATSEDLANVPANTYNVIVTDAAGCTASLGVTVTQPAALALSDSHVNVCTGGTNGSIDLTVAGGTEPYGYAWNTGATSQDLTGLGAGTYTVTVTDALGCTSGRSVTISVIQHSIVSTAGSNGTISPLGTTPVDCGTDQTYTITPNSGYLIDQLLVDSSPVTPTTSYTFTNVTADHTIDATFASVTAVAPAPVRMALGSVVPNPMHGGMQVPFGMPNPGPLHLSIVDLQGRELAVLADGEYPAGWHSAAWDGRTARGPAGAGLYFVRFHLAGRTLTRKFVLAR